MILLVYNTYTEPAMTFILQDCLSLAKDSFRTTGFPLVVAGTTSDPDKIPVSVMGEFKQEITVEVTVQRFFR
jgi:peroxin-6